MESAVLKQAVTRVVDRTGRTLGTGFLISAEGFVLTCWHVVEDTELVRVHFEGDAEPIAAEICLDLSSRDLDLVVLRTARPIRRAAAELGSEWRIGDPVWSYGYQYQDHFTAGYPVTGRLSGDTRIREQQFIVVSDTDVQRGLSGAPMLNRRTGKVIALINAKFDDRGIGFAVPIASARRGWSGLEAIVASPGAFAANTANLFQALGYELDGRRPPATPDGLAAFFAELDAGATRIRAVIGCLEGDQVHRPEEIHRAVFTLATIRDRERLDRAFLIILDEGTGSAPAAGDSAGVEILAYHELEGRLIDFTHHLRTVVHDFENFDSFASMSQTPVIEQFRWCDLYRYYIEIGCVDPRSGEEYASTRVALEEFLQDDTQNHLSLLGDYGTGKSTVGLQLTYDLAKQHLANPLGTRIPLFVPLRNLDLRTGIRRLILDTLADYGVRVNDPTALDLMMRSGQFLVILDGFDEAVDHLDRRSVMQAFSQISHLTTPRAKVVLTCRTHYFRTESQSYATLTPKNMTPLMREVHRNPNFRILELKKFDEPQIVELLSRHSPDYRRQWRMMQGIYNLADLARTPILANIMINSLDELLSLRSRGGVDSAALYDVYTKYWLERDDGRSDVTTEQRSRFTQELAWRMYLDGRLEVPHEELAEAIAGFFTGSDRYGADWLDKLDTNIRTCSFLARTKRGDYMFAHKSFMEFFVAKALLRQMNQWARPDLWPRAAPYEIALFLSELLPIEHIGRIKQMSVDRENNDFLRGMCMDVQIIRGDTMKDEPVIFAIAVSPDGRHVATANADCRVRVFDSDLEPVALLSEHDEWVRCVAYSDDGRFLASGGWDNRVVIRSADSYEVYREMRLTDRINALCFTRDSARLLCAGFDRAITIWDVQTGQLLDTLEGHSDVVQGVVLDPTTGDAISASTDRSIMVWPLERPGAEVRVEAQDEPIRCVAVSPDGLNIATGSWTGEMIVWDAAELRPVWRSESHTNMINGFSFAPDGKRLVVSCSDDRSMRVWSAARGELVTTLAADDFVMASCYSPDGRVLYSGGYDSVLKAWNTTSWDVVDSVPLNQGGLGGFGGQT